MIDFRSLLAAFGLTLAAISVQAQAVAPAAAPAAPESRYPQSSIGLSLGYGAPYGWGVDFSTMVMPKLDVNAGVGFSLTGAKVGVGTRYYFSPERKVSAFVGGNLVHSSGLNHVTITSTSNNSGGYYGSTNEGTVVNFKSTNLLHLRAGARWQPTYRFAMIGALGYGIVLGGDPVEYVDGDASQSARDLVNIFSPGGVELSIGVAFGLGSRN
ncbi:MAG: hypothetical protein JWR44_1325 [Hymenobacter sp.]|nr:hypothetical protein [Hymenobacter sp.]